MIPVVKTGRCKHHIASMCGRVIQSNGPLLAPSQDLLVIRRNHDTGAISLEPAALGSYSLLVPGIANQQMALTMALLTPPHA